MKITALICIVALLSSACATSPISQHNNAQLGSGINPNKTLNSNDNKIQAMYRLAQTAISEEKFALAEQQFSAFINSYPDDSRLPNALLGKAYAQYKLGENNAASRSAETFIKTFSNHSLMDYAHYLKGLTRYSIGIEYLQNNELVGNIRHNYAREAFGSFQYLVQNYPRSRYVGDSRLRMEVLFNKLAEYELLRAKDALEIGKNRDAIARAEYIIEHYSKTHVTQEAYLIMIRAYEADGDSGAAKQLREQFAFKFPGQLIEFGQDS